jgi:hypothetical protein
MLPQARGLDGEFNRSTLLDRQAPNQNAKKSADHANEISRTRHRYAMNTPFTRHSNAIDGQSDAGTLDVSRRD